MILQPLHGRDYKSKKALLDDFNGTNASKDCKMFVINQLGHKWDGKTCIKADLVGETVQFRYNGNRSTFVHKVK